MPIYEYKRPDGSTFDVIQKFTDDALTVDPESGVPVARVYTAPAIHFKGSGFHNTDYASNRRAKSGVAPSEPSSSSKSGDAAPKDSKPSGDSAGNAGGSNSGNGKDSAGKKSGDKSAGATTKQSAAKSA